jgi:hypothetical protein
MRTYFCQSSPTWRTPSRRADAPSADTRGDDVVVALVLLQHHPHRAHVVARKSPVATRVEVAERRCR